VKKQNGSKEGSKEEGNKEEIIFYQRENPFSIFSLPSFLFFHSNKIFF
jgi:hypothetical protein